MSFKLDFSKAQTTGGVKDGAYEVIVNRANEDATRGGTEYIEIDLIIRNDVEQAYQNAHIFAKIWKNKETQVYNQGMVMAVAQALNLEDGKAYADLDDLLKDFYSKTCRVTVKNETSEYNGKTYENLTVKRWEQSKTKGIVNHQFKNKKAQASVDDDAFGSSTQIGINDDNLPF